MSRDALFGSRFVFKSLVFVLGFEDARAKEKHLPQLAGQRGGQSRDLSTSVAAKCCPVRLLLPFASACLARASLDA